ncbi:GntR family transcriptional regulator [Xanthobacter dioxanivorans]|uniref:GntR family transcriptional regulator n=1 Tax=Xanthobacter dioxanivorans TaxID=2528964 RepID=A0A974PRS0_9HYPH|nr:GntR family transcriptional regulator [Xanthobacter dioxanivorans]QRG08549.1 GntR family transcriptional regulator [Xanthobacter dioxanivorans]
MKSGVAKSGLKHRTLSAAILDQLRQAILDGSHPAGTQLRQDALAELYGVSRIPVREALFQLEAEGLVRMVPQKGAIVSGLSVEEIDDVFELRRIMEPRLLARSAPLFDAEDLARLDAIHAQFTAAVRTLDVSQWGILNADFHMALYARALLPRTRQIVAALLQTSDRYTRLQLSTTEAMGRAESEHARLIAMCRAGEVEDACRFLDAHIATVHADLLRVIENRVARANAGTLAKGAVLG